MSPTRRSSPSGSRGSSDEAAGDIQGAEKALTRHGIGASGIPRFLVFDTGSAHTITGISCDGNHEQAPKDFALYLSSKSAPKIDVLPPDQFVPGFVPQQSSHLYLSRRAALRSC